MTNSERAEKITEEIYSLATHWTVGRQPIIDRITSQLDEAVAEARVAMREENFYAQSLDQKYQQGFATAREKAAGIAEVESPYNDSSQMRLNIAERIRSMSNELIPRR